MQIRVREADHSLLFGLDNGRSNSKIRTSSRGATSVAPQSRLSRPTLKTSVAISRFFVSDCSTQSASRTTGSGFCAPATCLTSVTHWQVNHRFEHVFGIISPVTLQSHPEFAHAYSFLVRYLFRTQRWVVPAELGDNQHPIESETYFGPSSRIEAGQRTSSFEP